MSSWTKATLLGLMVWLVPFVVAFLAFPLKESWRSLFESIMPVSLSLVTVACAVWYFRRVWQPSLREGALLGVLWFAICAGVDLPLMLSPPMNYTLAEYAADIGLTYTMIPIITVGISLAAARNVEEPRT